MAPSQKQWEMMVYRDPLLKNVTILVVTVIERGPHAKYTCTPIFMYKIDHFVDPLSVFQVVASVFQDTMAISSAFFVIVGTRTLLLDNTWRIIPVSKWLTTMVSKSPNWGCSLSKRPKWLINGGY